MIVVIDPRTGEIVQRWEGFLEPQDLTEKRASCLSRQLCVDPTDALIALSLIWLCD